MQKKISVLIPSYNHVKYIEEAVRSVWQQNYKNLELIIIDDGSKDGSFKLLEDLQRLSPIPMRVLVQDNSGICKTLNRAVLESNGEILCFLASDDVMLPNRINIEAIEFEKNHTLNVLYTNGRFNLNGNLYGDLHRDIKNYLKKGVSETREYITSRVPAFYIQGMLIKRNFIINVGGFDEDTGSDDWSLNIRIFNNLHSNEEYLFIDRPSFIYRVHDKQVHNNTEFMTPMMMRVAKKYFSLIDRSKLISKIYFLRALKKLLKLEIKSAKRYFIKAKYIAFQNGFPLGCLFFFFFELLNTYFNKCLNYMKNLVNFEYIIRSK